jgi:hypothetical protein
MLKRTLTITVIAAAIGLAAASPANARVHCSPLVCGENGTQLTGVAVRALEAQSIELKRVDIVIPQGGKQPKK